MTTQDMINDVKKLIGLKLSSIRPGAEIIILSVDEEQDNLILRTANGSTRSRPLKELRLLWDLLNQRSVVHVDEALHGSGTSRNQPETILANLPYVEWLKVNGKKNLSFVGEATHAFGTLKQMDPFKAVEITSRMLTIGSAKKLSCIIVTTDIKNTITALQRRFTGSVEMAANGIYRLISETDAVLIATTTVGLEPGSYPVIHSGRSGGVERDITILGEKYELLSAEYQILICE